MKKKRLIILIVVISIVVMMGISINIIWNKIMNTRHYVYCQLIRPGMTKQEVDAALQPLEPNYDGEEGPTYYYLHVRANNDFITQLAVGYMSLSYDKDRRLVHVGRMVSLGDWGEGAKCK